MFEILLLLEKYGSKILDRNIGQFSFPIHLVGIFVISTVANIKIKKKKKKGLEKTSK